MAMSHQGETCLSVENKLAAVEHKEQTMSGEEWRRFEKTRRRLEEELKTRASLQKKTKTCPKCRVKIEKIGGLVFN